MIYIICFFISFVVTVITTFFVIKFNIIDHPNDSRWHKRPVATLGGIAILFGFLLSVIISLNTFNTSSNFESSKTLLILSTSIVIFILGAIDDLIKISPKTKFIFQVSILLIFNFIENNFFSIFLFVWTIYIVNALNLIDNMDGLSSGVALIASLFIFEINLHGFDYFYALSSIALAGSCAGFLFFNFKPAKIFMGDCGSMFLGFLLSVLSYPSVGNKNFDACRFLVPIIILNIPIFDTLLVIFIRLKNRIMPWKGGKDHSSHRLVFRLRGNERNTVLVFYAICIFSGLLAIFIKNEDCFTQHAAFIFLLLGMLLFGIYLSHVPYNYLQGK